MKSNAAPPPKRRPQGLSKQEIGRLAFRQEGDWWNAYWSPEQHSMQKAVHLGSIRMSVVVGKEDVRKAFMALMRLAFEGVVAKRTGQTLDWSGERPAPETERSGRA